METLCQTRDGEHGQDAPERDTLRRIRAAARIARERLELAPDLPAAADALEQIEALAAEAIR